MAHSNEFQKLISDPAAFAEIMKFNESSPVYEEWEQKRRFIADTINGDGSILDIGCAGGLLLRSLQEWTSYKLDPYGVDIVEDYITAAKKLYPDLVNHFAVLDARKLDNIFQVGLPTSYDYVYWNFLQAEFANDPNLYKIIENILNLATKRVIFGFYARNNPEATQAEYLAEREKVQGWLDKFKNNWPVSGSKFNPTKFNQAIAWIDK
ncbi:MAG: class I SAM-dependent methyltransferase [Candidatus Saccharibacteria bacterium]